MLKLQNISFGFGELVILDRVDLDVPKGSIVGLVGPNGAGKSTLFAVLSGFVAAAAGTVVFNGEDISQLGVVARARRGLLRTFQVPREFGTLSVRENFAVALHGQKGEKLRHLFLPGRALAQQAEDIDRRISAAIERCGLSHLADSPASKLSGGQKKLLELGRATMLSPRLLLLDEPFNGVNPAMISRLSDAIVELNRAGTTLLIIEHNLAALAKLTNTLHVMDRGSIIASGEPAAVFENPKVREAYLGSRGVHHA
ncbi:MAG TPA: ABC transporter ATP-binding protein [Xanthobacteraceae bacterium]|nr:ABC transporter ATP-binding protein [Xanthobacteraceae bacterium]